MDASGSGRIAFSSTAASSNDPQRYEKALLDDGVEPELGNPPA